MILSKVGEKWAERKHTHEVGAAAAAVTGAPLAADGGCAATMLACVNIQRESVAEAEASVLLLLSRTHVSPAGVDLGTGALP